MLGYLDHCLSQSLDPTEFHSNLSWSRADYQAGFIIIFFFFFFSTHDICLWLVNSSQCLCVPIYKLGCQYTNSMRSKGILITFYSNRTATTIVLKKKETKKRKSTKTLVISATVNHRPTSTCKTHTPTHSPKHLYSRSQKSEKKKKKKATCIHTWRYMTCHSLALCVCVHLHTYIC